MKNCNYGEMFILVVSVFRVLEAVHTKDACSVDPAIPAAVCGLTHLEQLATQRRRVV